MQSNKNNILKSFIDKYKSKLSDLGEKVIIALRNND